MTIVASSSSSSSSPNKMITLESSDGGVFQVEESMAFLSETIEHAVAVNPDSSTVRLQDVKASVLAAIIRYMNDVSSGRKSADAFAKELIHDQDMLFGVLKAAYRLKIEPLTHSLCRTVADMMRGKSIEEIRELFHIKCDYTEAELKQLMEDYDSFLPVESNETQPEDKRSQVLRMVDHSREARKGRLSGGADLDEDEYRQMLRKVERWRRSREARKARLARVFGPISGSEAFDQLWGTMKSAIAESGNNFSGWSGPVMTMVLRYVHDVYLGNESSHNFAEELTRDPGLLFGVLHAANYLRLEPLSNLIYKTIADMMKRKSVAEVHELFKDHSVCSEAQLKGVQEQISRFLE